MSISSNSFDPMLPQEKNVPCRTTRVSKTKRPEVELIANFWTAPSEAFFGQETIAPVTNRSIKTLERDRWLGAGIPYRKCSGRVLYRKADVISWIESYELVYSTSEYKQEVSHG